MKNLKLALLAMLALQTGLINSMDKPNGWKPTRPSGSGRPRPTAVYGAQPLTDSSTTPLNPTTYTNPLHDSPTATATPGALPSTNTGINQQAAPDAYDSQLNFFMNAGNHGHHPAQPAVTNPMHIINTGATQTATPTAPVAQAMTAKEYDRLHKIEKDLDKIEEVLKEMGFDLAFTALSAASLDPIGAAFAASNSVITIPKLAYYYGNMQKHIFFLSSSNTSAEAKARLKQLTPRLQTVSRIIAKGPNSLQKLIKKFSKDEPLEAK